ncbi:uncharacterized protein BDZ99DRAFT_298409 [Mytilinidion resinicola]|uniref:F-box domain-containing protein n=1 Tax=Mytilinidion resinicola TaxID=574789 RepID=A0A6A6YR54_9PEZI|nr:uncharacterized protein BDZ99DRAFT_298409 [Mytilinidion resinicola]KAF2811251.1 hypothetical protein BDZ99DRAFT_298409 [Mytilinidion resinicola]
MSCLTGCGSYKHAKMPEADEKGTVGCILFLRFCEVIVVGILAFAAKDNYQLVKDHDQLSRPPYNKNVILSQELLYAGSMAAFGWTFVGFGLILTWKGWAIFWYGLVDLTLSLVMAVGAAMQASYLPATLTTCKKADTWQVHGDYPSFFALAASYRSREDANDRCHSFVLVWILGVVVIVFQMLIAYIGIFSDIREYSILNPYRPFAWFVVIVFGGPYWLACATVRRSRFLYRLLKKVARQLRGCKPIEFEKPPKYVPNYSGIKISNPKLENIFNIEHLLLPIASNLHYDDLINLSLTSKSVREAVFPAGDYEHRVRKLKAYSCNNNTKSRCEYCNKQVCAECTQCARMPGLAGLRHLQLCRPSCTKCYFKSIRPGLRRTAIDKRQCRCWVSDASMQDHWICAECYAKSKFGFELQAARERRYKKQLREYAQGIGLPDGQKLECRTCKTEMQGGSVRWWVCSRCFGECTSHMHPAHARVMAPGDLEKGEEGDAEAPKTSWLKFFQWN